MTGASPFLAATVSLFAKCFLSVCWHTAYLELTRKNFTLKKKVPDVVSENEPEPLSFRLEHQNSELKDNTTVYRGEGTFLCGFINMDSTSYITYIHLIGCVKILIRAALMWTRDSDERLKP